MLARKRRVGDAACVQSESLKCRVPHQRQRRLSPLTCAIALLLTAPISLAQDEPLPSSGAPTSAAPKAVHVPRRKRSEARSKIHDAGVTGPLDASVATSETNSQSTSDAGRLDAGALATAPLPTDAAVATGTASSTSASSTALATAPKSSVEVRVRDALILTLHLSDGGLSAAERAKRATQAIEHALGVSNAKSVHVEQRDNRSIVFIGEQPVVELSPDDAAVANEGSLDLYSASVAARISDLLRSEEQRNQLARTVISVIVAVVAVVCSLYLMRKISDWTRRLRIWVERNPQRIPAIHFKSIEVVNASVLHGATLVALSVAKWFSYAATAYACLIIILSRFDSTRGYTDKLAGVVLSPLLTLTGRIATLLPLTVIVALVVIVLLILLRFIGLFFAAVERGETRLERLSPALAAPTSMIVRVGLVIFALLVVTPALTGNVDGTSAKLGLLAAAALALAASCVPLLTTVLLGVRVLYTNRLSVGQWVSIGSLTGRVLALTLFETRIWVPGGVTARVPHLLLLWHPVRTCAGIVQRAAWTIVRPADLLGVIDALTTVAAAFGQEASVSLESVSASRVQLVIQVTMPESRDRNSLMLELLQVLQDKGVALAEP